MSSDEVLRLTGRRSKGRRVRMVSGEGGAVRAGKTRREARDRRRGKADDGLWHLRGFSAVRDVLLEIWLARTGGNIYLFTDVTKDSLRSSLRFKFTKQS